MPTHAAVAGFDRVGDAYERGRPDYPTEVVDHVLTSFGVGPGRRFVDLGAGTGKFTRALAARGANVLPVEPTRGMRLVLHRLEPERPVLAALADHLPLRSSSIDAITAASAFHWFATPASVEEIVRVLRPGGGLALVWNVRDESSPWTKRLGEIIDARRNGTPTHREGAWRAVIDGQPGLSPLERREFRHTQTLDLASLIDRVLSISFMAMLPPSEQEAVVDELRALLDTEPATRGRSSVELPYRTDVYLTRRRSATT